MPAGIPLAPIREVNPKRNVLMLESTNFQEFGRRAAAVLRSLAMFENLGKALSLIREIRGKSQARAAREAGIAKSQLSKYESGKELPKLQSLTKVLKALEVGPFEIFYTMHLIDLQAAHLDLRRECRLQGLPPLTLAGRGLLSDGRDAAFQRLLDDVTSLYNSVFLEVVSKPPRKN